MHTQSERRSPARARITVLLLSVAGLTASAPALAIPSPDLVINLSASVAQLLGLLSVVFGGFAMSSRKKVKKRGRGGKTTGILFAITGVLLLGSLVSNLLQYTASVDATNQRLQTNLVRKSVENGETVGDVSLKTLSFSEQTEHPLGIETETLADWLASDTPLTIVDVREDEEFETGAIKGALHLRYPDVLARSSLIPENANTLFLCYSGNRSSELCTEFEKQGRSCNFMIGGYEKWMTESRPLGDRDLNSEDLRSIPEFPNKATLLDTPDVHHLVNTRGAQFVDVRYPGDFVKDHLPGATNITMRALTSAALAERISGLSDAPVITPCYDKRSCFYAQLIGLRIHRAGGEFLGRYTVPHEYYVARGGGRAHVAAWEASQQAPTLASYVVSPLHQMLDRLTEWSGHYALGILAVVVLIRLALLPLALKADRDTQVQRSLSARVEAIKRELDGHPRAISEATLGLYKRYRIRPVVNMLASLFQLVLMLLFYSAVSEAAADWPQPLAWIETAATRDPLFVLPVLASALFVGVLWLQSPPKTVLKRSLFVLGGVALFALLQSLVAAANVYLAVSMAFLIGQSLLFRAIGQYYGWPMLGADKTGTIEDTGLVPLARAHYLPESTGKKAARLGELIEAGYRVPDGFVFTSRITNRTRLGASVALLDRTQKRQLVAMWRALKTDKVAVRSSGANEDGEDNSFAGVYESILNVSRRELLGAVREVYRSLASDRSDAYTKHTGDDRVQAQTDGVDQGGVVVQKMVPAEYAGVMFTEHPSTSGAMMVECVSGLAEDLVSGNVTPKTFAFGRRSGELMPEASGSDEAPRLDLQPLLALGRELEVLFGQPQDIEWAYAKGEFYLLQARDITRSITRGEGLRSLAEAERGRLLSEIGELPRSKRGEHDAGMPVFEQNELSELLPRPTPFSADLMGRLWDAGGSTDLACEALGIPYHVHFRSAPFLTTAFGWTYVNRLEERRRLGKGPGALATFRLARNAEALEQAFRDEFLPTFLADMIERDAIDTDRLPLADAARLVDVWVDRFVTETYREAELVNISADFHMKTALSKLESAGLEPTAYLADEEDTVVGQAMSLLRRERVRADDIRRFLVLFGHRAPLDYEIAEPRFSEDPALVRQYVLRAAKAPPSRPRAAPPALPEGNRVLEVAVMRAKRFQRLKEEAKHHCLRELAQIRRLLISIGRQTGLGDAVFHLNVSELASLGDTEARADLCELALSRAARAETWQACQLPSTLSIRDLERIDMLTGQRPGVSEQGELAGKRVAGDREVIGQVRVITDIDEIESFEAGEILVARMTDPTWYPLFSRARGIVTEVGGWLSHAAIVAREYDLPAIVGVPSICRELQTGEVVCLKLDGTVERVSERRAETSPMRGNQGDATVQGQSGTPSNERSDRDDAGGARGEDVASPSAATLGQAASASVTPLSQRGRPSATDSADRVSDQAPERRADRAEHIQQMVDRREFKNRLGDRRDTPRSDDQGETLPDRRELNREAYELTPPLKRAG